MKNLIAFICFAYFIHTAEAQSEAKWWGGYTVKEVVNKADLIFEGRVLTDSAFFLNSPGDIFTVHRVLVLKKFKGDYKSDTVTVITNGGQMILNGQSEGTPGAYAFKGDEAVFFATNTTKVAYGGSDPNTFCVYYGPGVSYVTPCNKKDVETEVYKPIENATGVSRIVLRKNSCEK